MQDLSGAAVGPSSSSSPLSVGVGVRLIFRVRGEAVHEAHIPAQENVRANVNEVHDEARVSNASCEYSGRHDSGPLPKLKEEGDHAKLLLAIEEAKRISNFVTNSIMQGCPIADTGDNSVKMEIELGAAEDLPEEDISELTSPQPKKPKRGK